MRKKLPGKMAGLKPGGGGKSKMSPPPLKQKSGIKKEDGGKKAFPFKKGGDVKCYAEGGAVQMKTDYGTKDGGPSAAGSMQRGTARGMGAAKRGGNFEY